MSKKAQDVVNEDIMQPTTALHKVRYTRGRRSLNSDVVLVELPLQIRLLWTDNNEQLSRIFSITMRTPGDDKHLIIGLLLAEGVISNVKQIKDIYPDPANEDQAAVAHKSIPANNDAQENSAQANLWEVRLANTVTPNLPTLERYQITYSSCGLCGATSLKSLELKNPPRLNDKEHWLNPENVHNMPNLMREKQDLFTQTGAAHAAGLFDETGQLVDLKEDVGRHNALDKLIGALALSQPEQARCLCIVVSGRISFELVQKTIMAGIAVMIAVGAPSDLAIKAAKRFGLTLIGYTNAESFNVYHGEWRLQTLEEVCQKT
ncbi:formate dehydrogenase accessory sulfurtransferase FdhD [Colwelliaceae bacterium 6471]